MAWKCGLFLGSMALLVAAVLSGCGTDSTPPTMPTPPGDSIPALPEPPPPPADVVTPPVAFVDVTVVPMDREAHLPGMTVVTRDGRITAVGPAAETAVPDSALVIDGAGAFLMPGLADMHTHISVVNTINVAPAPESAVDQGLLFVANGVTTILNMGDFGGHDVIALRARFHSGADVGPHIVAGHHARGANDGGQFIYRATTATQGRANVDRAVRLGYDFVKVYSGVTGAAFGAIVGRAGEAGLPVFGHVPTELGIGQALGGGQSMIAHASEFLTLHYARRLDPGLTPGAVRLATGAWTTTTLVASEGFRAAWGNNVNGLEQYLMRPRSGERYTHPEIQQRWRFWLGLGGSPGQLDAELPFMIQYTGEFVRAGAGVLLGTDAPDVAGVASGFSVHRELELLSQAGLTPYEALATATVNPGRFVEETLPEQESFGRIAVGARADLLLLRSDPLADIAHARDRVGVMARGRWYAEEDLRDRLEALASSYGR